MSIRQTGDPGRDERLGALLRELQTPEHAPQFEARLLQRLAEERAASTRWRLAGERAAASSRRRLAGDRAPSTRRSRRGAGTRRRSRAPGRRWRDVLVGWPLRTLAVTLSVAAAAVVALVGLPGASRAPSPLGPQIARAALVRAHLRGALERLHTLSGVLVSQGPTGGPKRFRFTLDSAGDLRLGGPRAGDVETYDAAAGVVRSAEHSESIGGDTRFYALRTGVAPGPPDQGPPDWILPESYGAYVRALLESRPASVRTVVYGGRPAWQVVIDTIPNAIAPELSGNRLMLTVDKRSGLPVRVIESKHGRVLQTLRITGLDFNPRLAPAEFRLRFPRGAQIMRSDDGFRRVPIGRVAARVGYSPLLPGWLPSGYRLAQVRVARHAAATGKEGGNPPSRMVVSLCYRHGLEQLVITTRLRGIGSWSDPLASPEGFTDHPRRETLSAGALAGTQVHVVLSPHALPHLWALTSKLVVTVSGDLGPRELTRIADSLHRRR